MLKLSDAVGRAFRSPAPYLSWAAITALLAISGPFGTFDRMSLAARLADFALVVGICIAWGVAARIVVQRLYPDLGFWAASLLVIGFSALVLAIPIRALVWGGDADRSGMAPPLPTMALLILIFGVAATVLRWALTRELPSDPSGTVPADVPLQSPAFPAAPLPRLIERLPPDLRAPLIRVSGRNHYVEVATEYGAARILLRLSDALSELGGVDGARVHRSHWVAARAVIRSERGGGKQVLVLSDGSRVPVSRNYQDSADRLSPP